MWAWNNLGHFLVKSAFHGHHFNKGMTVHWEDRTISYDGNGCRSLVRIVAIPKDCYFDVTLVRLFI